MLWFYCIIIFILAFLTTNAALLGINFFKKNYIRTVAHFYKKLSINLCTIINAREFLNN